MKQTKIDLHQDFAVAMGNDRSQAAVMVIPPGDSEGGPGNRHSGSDQWLFVIEGEGGATVDGNEVKLERHSLLLIERGESHEIRNSGDRPLRTLNFYVPPAYGPEGEALPAGEG